MLQYRYIRNILLLLLGASTLFSCQNTIDLNDEDFTPRLALTYLGSTEGEKTQRFYISETFISKDARLIKDAKLEVFVNDELKETITSSTLIDYSHVDDNTVLNHKSTPQNNPYVVKSRFKAGDKVRFRASHPKYPSPAEAEIVVPKTPMFDFEIKEVERKVKGFGSEDHTRELLQLNIKVQDFKNEKNYYRLKIHYTDDSGKVLRTPHINNKEDYILMKGEPQTDNSSFDLSLSGDYRNKHNVFSDELFRDKEGNITVYCDTPNDTCWVKVTVESINSTLYHYLQVLDNSNSENPLVTPSLLPTNVKGGVGVVSIANSNWRSKIHLVEVKMINYF